MCFPCSRGPHEDGILFLLNEMEIEEVHHLRFTDGFGEREVEGIDGFDHREVGLGDEVFDASLLAGGHFLRGQNREEISGREVFSFCFL